MKIEIPADKLGNTLESKPIGIILGMPEELYFKVPAFSYSLSREFAKSPAHAKAYLARPPKIDPDREFFKACHLLALEPERAADVVVVDGVWSAKVKEEKIIPLKKEGKLVLKQDDFDAAKLVADGLKKNPLLQELLDGCASEASIFWMQNGVYCKARLDVLHMKDGVITLADLKGFDELSSDNLLMWQIINSKYDHQMAWYSLAIESIWGYPPVHRKWVFMESKAPFCHKVKIVPSLMVDNGIRSMLLLLHKYKSCLEFDHWPGYSFEEEGLSLPPEYGAQK